MDDHEVARTLASEAGELLVRIRHEGGAAGDQQSNELLLRRLAELRPDDGVLSEESVVDKTRLETSRVWIIDPLDGTREYGEPPRDDWAVHVALTVDGLPVAGAVGLPGASGLILDTGTPPVVAPAVDGPPRPPGRGPGGLPDRRAAAPHAVLGGLPGSGLQAEGGRVHDIFSRIGRGGACFCRHARLPDASL